MPNPAAAIAGGTIISTGASLWGSDKASDASKEATNVASDTQLKMFYQNREDLTPWREAGTYGLEKLVGVKEPTRESVEEQLIKERYGTDTDPDYYGSGFSGRVTSALRKGFKKAMPITDEEIDAAYEKALADWRASDNVGMLEKGPGEYTESPGYQFRLSEGEKAINRAAAARGGFDSGKAYKSLIKYNQDYATGDYDNFLRRWYQSLNPYLSMADMGQIATTDTAQMGTQVAGDVARNTMAGGSARASGYLNTANALNEGVDSGISNYLMWKYINKN